MSGRCKFGDRGGVRLLAATGSEDARFDSVQLWDAPGSPHYSHQQTHIQQALGCLTAFPVTSLGSQEYWRKVGLLYYRAI